MKKEILYQQMNIIDQDILKGESLLASYSTEERKLFLSDIYAEHQPEGFFMSISYLYGEYPDFRKVMLINIGIGGSDFEKERLAAGLSHPFSNEGINDFFHLTYEWIKQARDPFIFKLLSSGLLYYFERNEVKSFIEENIDSNLEFVKGMLSWFCYQPDWFRDKYRSEECNLWKRLLKRWGNTLNDDYTIRQINKALQFDIKTNEIWFHEIENPWNFSDHKIGELSDTGIDIRLSGDIREFAMGSPCITTLVLNDKPFETAIGGPFVADDRNKYLCCTTFSRNEGFTLILIELTTNRIIEIHTLLDFYSPYKFENGEFIIIVGKGKIDLNKDTIRFSLDQLN